MKRCGGDAGKGAGVLREARQWGVDSGYCTKKGAMGRGLTKLGFCELEGKEAAPSFPAPS